jgi:catecholate siderophore receptor
MRLPFASVLACSLFVSIALLPATAAGRPQEPVLSRVPIGAASQLRPSSLRGRVLDATGSPVPRAQVTAAPAGGGAPLAVSTNVRGEFVLSLAPGAYDVTIALAGFQPVTNRITVAAGTPTWMDVLLAVAGVSEVVNVSAAVDEGGAVTSATKTPTPLRDVPQAVSIVSRGLIAEQRMTSMADVVRYMPGVQMAQGEGNRDTPVLRGNSSTADFFVDGLRDDVQYFRDVYNVERVEALKGPNAMIFGRGGAGGVINRVTRQAGWAQDRELTLQVGSNDNRRVTADLGAALNDTVAVRVTGVYEDSGSYRSHVTLERDGVQPSVAFRLGPDTLVRASYEYFHDERTADRGVPSFGGRPIETARDTFFGDPGNSPARATVNVFASAIEHRFGGGVMLRNRLSYGGYDKMYQNVYARETAAGGTTAVIAAYNNATDRRNLFNQTDVLLTARTGRITHQLLAGLELGRQVTDNVRQTGYFSSGGSEVTAVEVPITAPTVAADVAFRQSATDADNHGVARVAALYVQDQMVVRPELRFIAGVRFDAFDVDFTDNRSGARIASRDRLLSPRLGVIYKPILPISIYGSYGITFVPRAGDQLSSLSPDNQSLDPETFRNYEAGLKWDVAPALTATAAVYRLERGNVAVSDPDDPTGSILVDAQRTNGIELELNGYLTPGWTLTGGYAYQDAAITRSLSASAAGGAALPHVPAHSLSLWSRHDLTRRWSAAVGLLHRSDIFASADNAVVLPGFARVDAAVFVDVSAHLRAQVNVENVLDASSFSSAHNNHNITPGPPRALRVALTARF